MKISWHTVTYVAEIRLSVYYDCRISCGHKATRPTTTLLVRRYSSSTVSVAVQLAASVFSASTSTSRMHSSWTRHWCLWLSTARDRAMRIRCELLLLQHIKHALQYFDAFYQFRLVFGSKLWFHKYFWICNLRCLFSELLSAFLCTMLTFQSAVCKYSLLCYNNTDPRKCCYSFW